MRHLFSNEHEISCNKFKGFTKDWVEGFEFSIDVGSVLGYVESSDISESDKRVSLSGGFNQKFLILKWFC